MKQQIDYKLESPLEEIFVWECQKYLDDSVSFDCQVRVNTKHERLRIDFVLSYGDERIAVECDGRDSHNPLRDELRDAILLGEGHFTTIYHFRGRDITYCPEDCLWLLSLEYPALFSERGRHQLNCLHELEIVPDLSQGEAVILRNPTEPYKRARIFRRNIYQNPNPYWHWRMLYEFSCGHSRINLDNVMALWQRRFEKEGEL